MRMSTDREHSEQQTKKSRWGFRGMTVRDWLPIVGALLVPLVLALGIWGITWQLDKLENQRAEAERELVEQRAQDEALRAYLDQMSQLILDRKLLEVEQGHPVHEPGDPVHTLAQARTSTAILRLDAQHNESVTRFLTDSGLATSSESSATLLSEIALSHATLSNAHLPNADLSDADLSSANLTDANLFSANLSGADLNEADLSEADLSHAYMPKTDLSDADLNDAILRDADLSGAKGITNEELKQQATTLEGATMPNGQKYEDWLKSKENKKSDG